MDADFNLGASSLPRKTRSSWGNAGDKGFTDIVNFLRTTIFGIQGTYLSFKIDAEMSNVSITDILP